MIIGLVGHTLVQLVDNIMVGQLGTAELAAVSLGNSFVFIGLSLGIGFSTAITPLVAESDGEEIERTKNFLSQSYFVFASWNHFGTLCTVGATLLFSMGQPPEVAELAYPYLFWVGLSLIPLVSFRP